MQMLRQYGGSVKEIPAYAGMFIRLLVMVSFQFRFRTYDLGAIHEHGADGDSPQSDALAGISGKAGKRNEYLRNT